MRFKVVTDRFKVRKTKSMQSLCVLCASVVKYFHFALARVFLCQGKPESRVERERLGEGPEHSGGEDL